MPLVDPSPNAPPKPRPQVQQIAAPEYRGVTVDTKYEPVDHLLTHVEGSSWTVNYYSQVLDTDSPTMGQGMSTNPIFQGYRLIKGMELKVSTALTTSQIEETTNLDVQGSATVYPFIIPNKGDMFIADTGAGQEGVYQVLTSDRKSVFKQSVHEITYKLVAYSKDRLGDLNAKTLSVLQYDREFIKYGQNPLLFEEEALTVAFLRRQYKAIFQGYIRTYRSREYNTLLVPSQEVSCTDTFLTKFITTAFDIFDVDDLRYVKRLNTDDDYSLRAMQIFEVLQRRDFSLLNDAFIQWGKVSTLEFTSDPMLEGIFYSGIGQVIYPVDPVLTVDYGTMTPVKLVDAEILDPAMPKIKAIYDMLPPSRRKILGEAFPDVLDGFTVIGSDGLPVVFPKQPPLIKRAMADGYYVFSQAFYLNDQYPGAQSQLELLVRDYLVGNALNNARLKALVMDMPNWNTIDRFYFTPIILLLIKASIRGL